jgi:hypothetical protein
VRLAAAPAAGHLYEAVGDVLVVDEVEGGGRAVEPVRVARRGLLPPIRVGNL